MMALPSRRGFLRVGAPVERRLCDDGADGWGKQQLVVRTVASGRLVGTSQNDVLTGVAQHGQGQIHVYAAGGSDVINLDFADAIDRFSHGHHARGDGDGSNDRGRDTFNFMNTHNVSHGNIVVGRLEDLDSRDRVLLEGKEIDLANPPANVRIVAFNGAHNDVGATPQQWILITTSTGGHIFYALEGARVDMTGDGGANGGNTEKHYIHEAELPDFERLRDVAYTDPQNYVPAGFSVQGGLIINDDDENVEDVRAQITGSGQEDLIAAGLNDDTVLARGGDDYVWGGSGHDTILGQNGDDTVLGGTGRDRIIGGKGNDRLHGGADNDVLGGWGGDDLQYGEAGNDRLYGQQGNDTLDGGAGNDRLFGATDDDVLHGGGGADRIFGGEGSDLLSGGEGADTLTGGLGADVFEFKDGDLVDWDDLGGSWTEKSHKVDLVTDFLIGTDVIVFDAFSAVAGLVDLQAWKTTLDGNVHFTLQVRSTRERILVDVEDTTSWGQFWDAENFLFL